MCLSHQLSRPNPYVLAQMPEYFSVQLGQSLSDSMSLLKSFDILYA